MNYHQRIVILALAKNMYRANVISICSHVFQLSFREAMNLVSQTLNTCQQVRSQIVRYDAAEKSFYLENGDGAYLLNEEFLSGCELNWREELYSTMKSILPEQF